MRHLLALLPLLVACSSDPSPPSDATAGDVAAADASDAAGSGSCPEAQRWCSFGGRAGDDLCFSTGAAGSASGCVPDSRILGCPLPPPCWVCPNSGRRWRRADLDAHNAARADAGVCPDYGAAGVPAASLRD